MAVDDLLLVEQRYLNMAQTEPTLCYNKKFIAGGGSYGEVSLETRQKQSENRKGELNPRFNSRLFTFQNKSTNEIRQLTKFHFKQMVNGEKKSVDYLLRGKANSVKGWMVLDSDIQLLRTRNTKPRKSGYVFTDSHRRKLAEHSHWKRRHLVPVVGI